MCREYWVQIDIVGPPLAQGMPSDPKKDGYEKGYEAGYEADGRQQQWQTQPPPYGASASYPLAQPQPAQY